MIFRIFFILVFALFPLTWGGKSAGAEDLDLLAGAGLRQPTDKLISLFRERTGNNVFVDYAGSGHLLARILASGHGDLFMPGAFYYIQKLEQDKMVHSYQEIVFHTAVIGVNRDRGDAILSFDDLARTGTRLAIGDPKAMAFGRISMEILEKSELKDAILKNVVVYGATVKQLALYVAQGDADAAIIGRADAIQYKREIRTVPIPSEYYNPEIVAIALLKKAADRPCAIQFRDFMCGPEAVEIFKEFGFLPLTESER
jgi:molybdate transport system substrate-binding protein